MTASWWRGDERAAGAWKRGMLGRFKRDRVHAKWSTAVCVRPRSTEDAPGCLRNGWTTLVAVAAPRHYFSRFRVWKHQEHREFFLDHQSNVHCQRDDHRFGPFNDVAACGVSGEDLHRWVRIQIVCILSSIEFSRNTRNGYESHERGTDAEEPLCDRSNGYGGLLHSTRPVCVSIQRWMEVNTLCSWCTVASPFAWKHLHMILFDFVREGEYGRNRRPCK